MSLPEKRSGTDRALVGSLKLSLHHIFTKIGYPVDILSEDAIAGFDLDDLRRFWGDFCRTNGIPAKGDAAPVKSRE